MTNRPLAAASQKNYVIDVISGSGLGISVFTSAIMECLACSCPCYFEAGLRNFVFLFSFSREHGSRARSRRLSQDRRGGTAEILSVVHRSQAGGDTVLGIVDLAAAAFA